MLQKLQSVSVRACPTPGLLAGPTPLSFSLTFCVTAVLLKGVLYFPVKLLLVQLQLKL